MNDDFLDMLAAFTESRVEFLVVGAHALAVHGVPRATGDLDIWVRATSENASRVMEALGRFGAPVEALGITAEDFASPRAVVQIGSRREGSMCLQGSQASASTKLGRGV